MLLIKLTWPTKFINFYIYIQKFVLEKGLLRHASEFARCGKSARRGGNVNSKLLEDNRPSLQGSREYPKLRIIIWDHGRLGDKAKVVGVNYTLRLSTVMWMKKVGYMLEHL